MPAFSVASSGPPDSTVVQPDPKPAYAISPAAAPGKSPQKSLTLKAPAKGREGLYGDIEAGYGRRPGKIFSKNNTAREPVSDDNIRNTLHIGTSIMYKARDESDFSAGLRSFLHMAAADAGSENRVCSSDVKVSIFYLGPQLSFFIRPEKIDGTIMLDFSAGYITYSQSAVTKNDRNYPSGSDVIMKYRGFGGEASVCYGFFRERQCGPYVRLCANLAVARSGECRVGNNVAFFDSLSIGLLTEMNLHKRGSCITLAAGYRFGK